MRQDLGLEVAVMQFVLEEMDQDGAELVASWHCEGEYAFYDFAADQQDMAELLNPQRRSGTVFALRDQDVVWLGSTRSWSAMIGWTSGAGFGPI
jgi:hypothetical protein